MRGYEEEALQNDHLLRSIKEQKEHAQGKIEELLRHFSDEQQYSDDLVKMGSKLQSRLRQFRSLEVENNGLKLQTRKLQEQLNLLKSSLQDSGWRQQDILNRMSVDRGKPEATVNTFALDNSSKEVMKPRLDEISKLKDLAREEEQEKHKQYDELLQSIFHFLEMSYNTKHLLEQMRPVIGDEAVNPAALVQVPREKYEMLVELYSITMADISARKFQKHLQQKIKEDPQQFNPLQASAQKQDQRYARMKEEGLKSANMETFFRQLSKKLGFEAQWERYHHYNAQQAVRMQKNIKDILQAPVYKLPQEELEEAEEGKKKEPLESKSLRKKLDKLVKELPFSLKEKKQWQTLYAKIQSDELIGLDSILKMFKEQHEQKKDCLTSQFAEFLYTNLSQCVDRLESLLMKKFNKARGKIFNVPEIKDLISKEGIQRQLQQKMKDESLQNLCKISTVQAEKCYEKIFQQFDKHFKFASHKEVLSILNARSQ